MTSPIFISPISLGHLFAHLRPEARGREDARGGGTLLALILEGAAEDRGRESLGVGARVRDDEVLAAGLADDAGVVAVAGDVLADRLPHPLEDRRRAGEVDAREVLARERGVADGGAGAVDEVDHAGRQAGFLEQLHEEVRADGRGRGRLPDDGVAHQRGRGREVAGDRGEVERRDGEDEALQRPVLEAVPDAGRGDRLLLVDARHVLDVEAPEVDELARGVDLGLVCGLGLAEHGGRVQRLPPRAGEELGRSEEDRGAVLPRCPRPVLPGVGRSGDRAVDLGRAALVDVGEDVVALVGHDRFERVAGLDVLAADHERDLEALGGELVEAARELVALGAAGLVAEHRLVVRFGDLEDAVGAHCWRF